MLLVDIEAALVDWLGGQFPNARVCTEVPANLGDVCAGTDGVICVGRIGGIAGQPTLDAPVVDVDCYGETRAQARALAVAVQSALLLTLPGQAVLGGAVPQHGVTQALGPSWRPYDDTGVRKFGATYSIATRAHA